MKKARNIFHLVLTALIGLLLPACHLQKSASGKQTAKEEGEAPDAPQLVEEDRRMICLYGIPPEVLKMREERDSLAGKE